MIIFFIWLTNNTYMEKTAADAIGNPLEQPFTKNFSKRKEIRINGDRN